eukprot:6183048-Pleurochrysis_carterae.AAC.2
MQHRLAWASHAKLARSRAWHSPVAQISGTPAHGADAVPMSLLACAHIPEPSINRRHDDKVRVQRLSSYFQRNLRAFLPESQHGALLLPF